MRNLKIYPGHPVLDKVLEKPFAIIDYEKATEVVNSRYFPCTSTYNPEYQEQVLGLNPQTIPHRMLYDTPPSGYIHELKDVCMYRGILHSQDGSAFIDSFRVFDSQQKVYRNYKSAARNLNGTFYIHRRNRDSISEIIYNEPVIPFFVHSSNVYGHWLMETLPLLWVLDYGIRGKLILSPHIKEIPDFLQSMLRPFGLDKNDLLFTSETMRFEKMFIPSKPLMLRNFYATDTTKRVWEKIARFYTSNSASGAYPRKVYLSRKGIPRRLLLNERECEEVFTKYGFTVIQPELLSFYDQIQIMSRATHVAGSIGSAMHNIVFSLYPDNVKILYLNSTAFESTNVYAMIENMFCRKLYTVYGDAVRHKKGEGYRIDYAIDIKNLETAIQQWLYQ